MSWVMVALGDLVCMAALAGGLWVWRRRWLPRAVIYGSLVLLTAWIWLCEAVGGQLYGFYVMELPVAAGLAILLLCGLASVAPEKVLRRPLLVLPICVFLVGGWSLVGPETVRAGWFGLDRSTDAPEVMQTTWWTCAPASLATLDRERGGHLTEADAAVLCGTVPFFGTRMAGLPHALRRIGLDGRLHEGWSLSRLHPGDRGLAMVRVFGRVLHCVAVLGVSDAGYDVFCPSFGRKLLTRQEFGAEWMGVWVELKAAR